MTKIKICGIKTLPDALAALEAGADLLGFNFYPQSPRFIQIDQCRAITAVLRKSHPRVTLVGVFVNRTEDEIRAILEMCQLHLAQLHGDETPELLAALGERAFKAIRLTTAAIRESESKSVFIRSAADPSMNRPALLVDSTVQGLYGGSGVVADWSVAAQLSKRLPILLAGGLTPENVAEAVRQVRPWGVDVASGVEIRPGLKDAEKMTAFVKAVRDLQ